MTQNTETLTQRNVWQEWNQALNASTRGSNIFTYLLAALVLVQLGLVGWTYWPHSIAVASNEPLFAELASEQVVVLTITDENDNQIVLTQSEAGEWVLPEAGDFPVTTSKVANLLEKIAEINTSRLVATNETSHARLSVAEDDFASRVEMTMADDTTHTLYIGTAPRTMATHVRTGDSEAVYLASNLRSSDAGPQFRNWIDTVYFRAMDDEIMAMEITNANGTLEFTRGEDEEWTIGDLGDNEEFNENNLISMVSSITSLNMIEPLGTEERSEYGMDDPNAVVTITTLETVLSGSDGLTSTDAEPTEVVADVTADEESAVVAKPKTYTLTIGAKAEEGNKYVIKSSESPYYVHVSGSTVERFIERGRSDFVTESEASTSEESIGPDPSNEDKESSLVPFSPLIPGENTSFLGPLVETEGNATETN